MKPPLIYTIERSGSHFIRHCFNHLFYQTIPSTHDKNRNNTIGDYINYKDYKVFATIREPKDIIISELNFIYECKLPELYENEKMVFQEAYLIKRTKEFLNNQEIYFLDLIQNRDFYIMPFKFFTKNTREFFLNLATDNYFSKELIEMISTDSFFENPLDDIFKNLYDPARYPRNTSHQFKEQILLLVEKIYLDGYFDNVNELYAILEKRYADGQKIV